MKGLLEFLNCSKTAFHGVKNISIILEEAGFKKLCEDKVWSIEAGGAYYTTRNDSSIIAFSIPKNEFTGFQIVASHSDSPSFKIKENPELTDEKYTKLNVEGYGGMPMSGWFDRPLSVAGRISSFDGENVKVSLVDIDKDLLMIPSLAIHMNRSVNDGYKYNVQKDMLPIIGDGKDKGRLMELLADSANTSVESIVGKDIFLYNRMKGRIWGAKDEYFSAPRIDNLECAYCSLQAFIRAQVKNVGVYCVFDNEEVGSSTKQGAGSTFLQDILKRIVAGLGKEDKDIYPLLSNSFMVSADNAHAFHPNYAEKYDESNRVFMNEGIVIKHSANQKYTTDGISRGIFKAIMDKNGIPVQDFVNRSDVLGGSTLGSIANTKVSIKTIDIGLAQLAMHSPYETAGVKDITYMIEGLRGFYETCIQKNSENSYSIEN